MTWCEDCSEDHPEDDEIERTWLIAKHENAVYWEPLTGVASVMDRGEAAVIWEAETGIIDYSEYYAEDIAWRIAMETIHDLRQQVSLLLNNQRGLQL